MRRVVVTGVGVVAPNGVGKDEFWSACVNGRSGVGVPFSIVMSQPTGFFVGSDGDIGRAGVEIVIGDEARPVAVVRSAEPHVRLLSESLRLAKEHASTATLDEDFARDLEAVINSHREPLNPPAWD